MRFLRVLGALDFEVCAKPKVLKGVSIRARRRARVHFARTVARNSCDRTRAAAFRRLRSARARG
eukprot:2538603-Pyramimonas_sp.AAC.1